MNNNVLRMVTMFSILTCGCSVSFADQAATKKVHGHHRLTPTKAAIATAQTPPVDNDIAVNTDTDATIPLPTTPAVQDPYEKFNRPMFTFNDKMDKYALKPIATFYNLIMPKPLNAGVHNVFRNLGEVPTIANDLLQFNFYQMTSDLWRFGINSTIGIGGLFDVATRINLPYYSNDFGLTLASWGYRSSNYLVLPFFGPNTIRDSLSIPVDYYGFSIYPYISPTSVRYEVYGVGIVDRRANLLQYQPVFEEAAIDKYVFMRNAYLQRRNHQIKQNQQLSAKDRVAAGKSVPFASDENSN